MSFSAAICKARELGERSLALARGPGGMVVPRANYPARPHLGVLVLQRGENPTTGYYLRPRLERGGAPFEVADLGSPPGQSRLFSGGDALLVIVCRYASASWLDALEQQRGRICRLAYFTDDDLPAMIADASLPLAARGKVAAHFGRHVDSLSRLASEVWMSTPQLARRYPDSRASILAPLPEADPPSPSADQEQRVVYHGSDVHGAERQFVVEIARRVRGLGCDAPFEVTADRRVGAKSGAIPGLNLTPQLAWPAYLAAQEGRTAAVALAPLSDSPVNAARAPVKVFDAARLGAAGIYADREPYRSFVRDGVDGLLVDGDPDLWARMIVDLLDDPERRRALAEASRIRLAELRRVDRGLPPAPGA